MQGEEILTEKSEIDVYSEGNIMLQNNNLKIYKSVPDICKFIFEKSKNENIMCDGSGLELYELLPPYIKKKPYFQIVLDGNNKDLCDIYNKNGTLIMIEILKYLNDLIDNAEITINDILVNVMHINNLNYAIFIVDKFCFTDNYTNKFLAVQLSVKLKSILEYDIVDTNIYEEEKLLIVYSNKSHALLFNLDSAEKLYEKSFVNETKIKNMTCEILNRTFISNTGYCKKLNSLNMNFQNFSIKEYEKILGKNMGYNGNYPFHIEKIDNELFIKSGENYNCLCNSYRHSHNVYKLIIHPDKIFYNCFECNFSFELNTQFNNGSNVKFIENPNTFEYLFEESLKAISEVKSNLMSLQNDSKNYKNYIKEILNCSKYKYAYDDFNYPAPKLLDINTELVKSSNYNEFTNLKVRNKTDVPIYDSLIKTDFKINLNDMTVVELILHRARLRTDEIIEVLHLSNETNEKLYDDHRLHLNILALKYGYLPYYDIDYDKYENYCKIEVQSNFDNLKRFPSSAFQNESSVYLVSDLSKLKNYITPRYIKKRIIFKNTVENFRGNCCGYPGEWPYNSLAIPIINKDENSKTESDGKNSKTDSKSKSKSKNDGKDAEKENSLFDELENPIKFNEDGTFKSFRIKQKKVHLTYEGHIPPKEYIDVMQKQLGVIIDLYSIVHENGSNNGENKKDTGNKESKENKKDPFPYKHTHVLLQFREAYESESQYCFDYSSESFPMTVNSEGRLIKTHPHIRKVVKEKHFDYLVNSYHKKEGIPYSNIEETIFDQHISKEILLNAKTSDELYDSLAARDPKAAYRYGLVHNTAKILKREKFADNQKLLQREDDIIMEFREWQKFIANFIKMLNDRALVWIWGKMGNEGKSKLGKHLAATQNAIYIQAQNPSDILHLISKECIERGHPPSIIVLNIPKVSDSKLNASLIATLENLKDGDVNSGKYEGLRMIFPAPPSILILSNYTPTIGNLALDRWAVFQIENDDAVSNFQGAYGKKLYDTYVEYELKFKKLAEKNNEKYEPIIPKNIQLFPIQTITQFTDVILFKKRCNTLGYLCSISLIDRMITNDELYSNKIKELTAYGLSCKYLNKMPDGELFSEENNGKTYKFRKLFDVEKQEPFIYSEMVLALREMSPDEKKLYEERRSLISEKKELYDNRHFKKIGDKRLKERCEEKGWSYTDDLEKLL